MNKIKVVSDKIKKSVFSVFKGKEDVVDMILCAIFAQGHVLLEDVPGTGKTVLAKALAKSIDMSFSRIQCTPDLMPSDITGNNIWLPAKQEFEFRKGPVMSSIVLVDELNRATPRTQSALLECMAENQVSVDGKVHPLEKPFFVIATENPVESEGTFPLPEAQKDRFMLSLSIGYPTVEEEIQIITAQNSLVHPVESVCAVVTKDEIIECMEEVVKIFVDDAVLSYLISLCNWTRTDDRILAGVSPRGSLSFYKACQAYAAIHGRDFVTPEDVKTMALPVFKKRIILKTDSILKGYTEENLVKELLDSIPIPNFKAHV
ncbi:MAG: MoxR family ATPase [Treponema sp.]|nr:MoxR family ATPase [Treponema sp.]